MFETSQIAIFTAQMVYLSHHVCKTNKIIVKRTNKVLNLLLYFSGSLSCLDVRSLSPAPRQLILNKISNRFQRETA